MRFLCSHEGVVAIEPGDKNTSAAGGRECRAVAAAGVPGVAVATGVAGVAGVVAIGVAGVGVAVEAAVAGVAGVGVASEAVATGVAAVTGVVEGCCDVAEGVADACSIGRCRINPSK